MPAQDFQLQLLIGSNLLTFLFRIEGLAFQLPLNSVGGGVVLEKAVKFLLTTKLMYMFVHGRYPILYLSSKFTFRYIVQSF